MKIILLSLFFFASLSLAETSACNKLSAEKSPYLQQHKNNPVCWQPWSNEVFKRAKEEGKPVFISIGYSTCYWCHVMEKEVFEKKEVAAILNEHFLSIKIDREERPDIDKVYMEALQTMTGRGGWPLNMFLNSDKEPFFGGTYFPEEIFVSLITNLNKEWKENPEKIKSSAQRLTKALAEVSLKTDTEDLSDKTLKKSLMLWRERFDRENGGFGNAPKFPPSVALSSLLRTYRRSSDLKALSIVTTTLEHMARGGIYDHLGGGFHRYSTDSKWLVPHFEKMLYDNALLAVVYLEAYQVTKKEMFKEVATEILNYVLGRMTSKDGAFYSAEDAGEVGKEGEYYIWKYKTLAQALDKQELAKLSSHYQVSSEGNFEGKNILTLNQDSKWNVKYSKDIQPIIDKLISVRAKISSPLVDDKILTSWNALMITALTKGYQVTGNVKFLEAAKRSALFIKHSLFKNGKLLRRFREGESRFEAYLDDYAYMVEALINLYESDFDIFWLSFAKELQSVQDNYFWDKKEGGYFYSSAKDILVRKKEFHDSAIPSANSTSLLNLQRLYGFYFDKEYEIKKERLFTLLSNSLKRYPAAFAKALHALDFELDRAKEIAIISSEKKVPSFLYKDFIPNKSLALGLKAPPTLLNKKTKLKGKTTFYVCRDRVCKLPTSDVNRAKKLIEEFEKIK